MFPRTLKTANWYRGRRGESELRRGTPVSEIVKNLNARAAATPGSPALSDYDQDIDSRIMLDMLEAYSRRRSNPPSQTPSKLSARQLRQAISLGSQMASSETLAMLAMKAQ